MTTAQRAKELAEKVRRSYQGDGEEQHDIATGLEELARMLEAALPESVQAVAEEWTGVSVSGALMKSAHSSILTLLDAYRVLAAERDARLADVLHLRAEADRSLVAMNKEREQHASVFADYESARAEVDRLTDSLDANKRALLERAHVLDEVSEVWNPGDAWNDMRWDEIMRSMASGYLAMKQRADRLAEGVRLYHLERVVSGSYNDDVNAWERANTDLVPRE